MRHSINYPTKQLTLGELLKFLEPHQKMEDGRDKIAVFDFGSALPNDFESWRGDYSHIALGYEMHGYDGQADYNLSTVKSLIDKIKQCYKTTFSGWKGGDYLMNENTPIWIANRGNSGKTGLVGIAPDDYQVVLLTALIEY